MVGSGNKRVIRRDNRNVSVVEEAFVKLLVELVLAAFIKVLHQVHAKQEEATASKEQTKFIMSQMPSGAVIVSNDNSELHPSQRQQIKFVNSRMVDIV